MFFDTHCHLNFKRLEKDLDKIIADAQSLGVSSIVIPGTDLESSRKAVQIASEHEGLYAAVGVHPHHVFDEVKGQNAKIKTNEIVSQLEELLTANLNGKIVAVGEIGLDKHEYEKTKYEDYEVSEAFIQKQKELFVTQLEIAKKYKKPVIIHNREATQEGLDLLRDTWDSSFEGSMVFHCCEPDHKLIAFAQEHNIFIGVDGDITYWDEKKDFVKQVPLDMLVFETDAPFLLPEPLRSQKKYPNVPANIPLIAQYVADIKQISLEEIAKVTTENAKNLFRV